MRIDVDDLSGPEIAAFLAEHVEHAQAWASYLRSWLTERLQIPEA